MGNQLSGIAPSQILPAENYLADLNSRNSKELEFQRSLGSTRFLKVVMCQSEQGPVVVKIFVIHDPSLPLNQQKKRIKDISYKLSSAVNCLTFRKVELTDRAAFITRQYIKSSLYDQISTRPFLSTIEKKWLAFQFLCALNQCHQEKICHGDIKLENILVTSWSWLVLTDFASYKPVLLPEDNPTDFTYYFDTSRRRVCHIAPERFIKTLHNEEEFVVKEVQEGNAVLTPAMDMFSAGCVLAELFTEGFYPFNLMQLLHYRAGAYYPQNVLERIADERATNMVEIMIKKTPSERKSAAIFLEEERGKLFPEYFYSFLWPFFKQFSILPLMSADERIRKVNDSIYEILDALGLETETLNTSRVSSEGFESDSQMDSVMEKSYTNILREEQEGMVAKEMANSESLIIITSLVTSCVRALEYPSSKLVTLELFKILSKYVGSDIILDRILPYILCLLKDNEPRVRAEALFALSYCLLLVDSVPRSEVNIFLEYILPHLNEVSIDPAIIVRQAEAANISYIADTALRFVRFCLRCCPNYSPDNEVNILQEVIHQKLAKLFSDPSNIVKRSLIEETLNALCLFFGKEKANDVLLSHLITFLNEKKDFHLRFSFYKNITGIASFMGSPCHQILLPLFLQGLSDTEETVIASSLENMSNLIDMGLFPDHILLELLKDTAPLLVHPNSWIRQAVVGLIVTMARCLEYIDVLTSVWIAVSPFTKKMVLQLNNEVCTLSTLKDPIPRGVYDTLTKSSDVKSVLETLQDSLTSKKGVRALHESLHEERHQVKNVLKRLLAAGLTDQMVGLILSMKDHLIKLHRHKKALETLQAPHESSNAGTIQLDFKPERQTLVHKFRLISSEASADLPSCSSISLQSLPKSSSLTMNEEWQTMFGNGMVEEHRSASTAYPSSRQSSSLGDSLSSQCYMIDHSVSTINENSASLVTLYQNDLENLLRLKQEEYLISMQSIPKSRLSGVSEDHSVPFKWKPKGHLVAHLHEHKGAITRLITLKGTTFYASSSKDGTVKLWDCNKTERTFPVNRSKFTYSQQKGIITTLAYCSVQESIASASDNSSLHVFKIDKQKLLVSRQLDKTEDGYALDLNYLDAGSQSVLTYSTVYGRIIGWDLRSPDNAWVVNNGVKEGLITSYAIDCQNNWLACGTSSGYVVCWDLRFMLPISQFKHPHSHSVQRLKIHPSEPSQVVASSRANNEVIILDLETMSRAKTMWASPNPPFSNKPSRSSVSSAPDNWMHGLLGSRAENGEVFVVTVGTDSRIRYWDLDHPESSYIISHPASYNSQYFFSYKSRVIDGTEVIVETMSPSPNTSSSDDSQKKTPDQPPTGHIETITDVVMVTQPQKMLITSGFDGTIKMWK